MIHGRMPPPPAVGPPGEDPSVLTWRVALAPRPRHVKRRHWWRDMCHDAYMAAAHAWELQAEAVALGYATELREFAEAHPRPRYKDFLVHLSSGRMAPPE